MGCNYGLQPSSVWMAELILRTNCRQDYRAVRFYFQVECVAAGQLDGRQEIVSQRYDQIASAISCILAFYFPAYF